MGSIQLTRRIASTLLVGGVLVSTGCSTSKQGSASAGDTTSPSTPATSSTTPATSPSVISPSEWVATSDPASGISFSSPGKVTVQTRPGNDGTPDGKRAYQFQVSDDLNVSVVISDGVVAAEDLDVLPDQLAEQLTAAGATDATVGERERTTVEGRPALDFQFSFTAKNGKRNFWLTREIAGERQLVLLQSIGFSATPDPVFENLVREYHRQLLAGVKLA